MLLAEWKVCTLDAGRVVGSNPTKGKVGREGVGGEEERG